MVQIAMSSTQGQPWYQYMSTTAVPIKLPKENDVEGVRVEQGEYAGMGIERYIRMASCGALRAVRPSAAVDEVSHR